MSEKIKETIKYIKLDSSVVTSVRQEIIDRGLVYLVAPEKHAQYEGNGMQTVELTPEQLPFFQKFIGGEGNQIGVDLESLLPFVTPGPEIGFTKEQTTKLEEGLNALVRVPEAMLKNPDILEFLANNISDGDKARLEINQYDPALSYLNPATILRADLLLTPSGRLLTCDPNIVPLGYTIVAEQAERVEDQTGLLVGPTPDYLDGIASVIDAHPGKISGIVTSLGYPNWSSHMSLAGMIRERYGKDFYVIPDTCFQTDGTIDLAKLNEFNRAFGISETQIQDHVPGMVIRYAREVSHYHPDTEVVNAGGIRLIETQLWSGLIMLPGFDQLAAKCGVPQESLEAARSVVVPTLIAEKNSDGAILIATSLHQDNSGNIELGWESLDARQDILVGCLWAIDCQEKPKELSWFVKTLSTSGKKGVKFTSDGRVDQTVKSVTKITDKMGIGEGDIFLVQPKVRSVTKSPDRDELRFKADMFISMHTGKPVLLDYMATPVDQRSAHGGSKTGLGLIVL